MDKDVEAAKLNDPKGATCGWCLMPNDLADDEGWWYIQDSDDDGARPTCRTCMNGLGWPNGER